VVFLTLEMELDVYEGRYDCTLLTVSSCHFVMSCVIIIIIIIVSLYTCCGYMWNKIIPQLFQPSSTFVWNNFISAHGNLPEIIS